MGWFLWRDELSEHEGAVACLLDSLDSDPVACGSDLIEDEGFRVVAWRALCQCGWTGPPTPRLSESLGAPERYSPDGFPTLYVEGFCEGTWVMHTLEVLKPVVIRYG